MSEKTYLDNGVERCAECGALVNQYHRHDWNEDDLREVERDLAANPATVTHGLMVKRDMIQHCLDWRARSAEWSRRWAAANAADAEDAEPEDINAAVESHLHDAPVRENYRDNGAQGCSFDGPFGHSSGVYDNA